MADKQTGVVGGVIYRTGILSGKVKTSINLVGHISIPGGYKNYEGTYEIRPSIDGDILETKNKLMAKDVVVDPIPYYEVSNEQGGTTVIIGGN